MIELITCTLASLYDALVRGICWAVSLGIVWVTLIVILRKTPTALKAIGIW
jgi:hypothetical protein